MSESSPDPAARPLFPAVRWHPESGFAGCWTGVERAIRLGVGGFIVFGGDAVAVRELTTEMRRAAQRPLLLASDLERGAGQQFTGATPLPPAAALASLDDPEVTRRAAALTAREARALGIGWVLAPVADLDCEPRNPIVGTRAFAAEPRRTARQVEAWVRGCAEGGALSCIKHFPGHGRTTGDSHVERPRVDASRADLEADLHPFRAGIAAGADAVMAAHVAFPAWDPTGEAATRSEAILGGLLRRTLGFRGIVATDAINMAGFSSGGDEGAAAARALAAGCDALLYPADVHASVRALATARSEEESVARRLAQASDILERAARRVQEDAGGGWGHEKDRAWALRTAVRTLRAMRGEPTLPGEAMRLIVIDDDLGGPHPAPSRKHLHDGLRARGVPLAEAGVPLLAVFADVRAWKRRGGLSDAARRRAAEVLASSPDAVVVLFGHPRVAADLEPARHLLLAWGGEPLMQEAVVAALSGGDAWVRLRISTSTS